MVQEGQTNRKLIPAPTGGWNARDPLCAMAENDAIELVNYFPDNATVTQRGGTSVAYTVTADASLVITTLMVLVDEAGAEKLCVIARDTDTPYHLYIFRLDSGVWTDISPATPLQYFDDLPYNWVQFKNRLFLASAGTAPLDFATTGIVTPTSLGVSPTTLATISVPFTYRGHLYYLNGSAHLFYLPLDYIAGTLIDRDLSSLLMHGGYFVAGGEVSKQSDSTNQNLMFLISSQGEVLVFQGDYPDAPAWSLVGRYFTGKPLGPKCVCYRGRDAHILTTEGIIPVNNLLNKVVDDGGVYQVISDKICNAWSESLLNYPADSHKSWHGVYIPSYKMFLVQPAVTHYANTVLGILAFHPVQNIQTGQWCNFIGMDAGSWVVCNDIAYFIRPDNSSSSRRDVLTMGKPGTTGNVDDYAGIGVGTPFDAYGKCAFNPLDDLSDNKHITGVKAFMSLTASTGHNTSPSTFNRLVRLGADSDFAQSTFLTEPNEAHQVILESIVPDGTVNYKQVNQVAAQGTFFSVFFSSTFFGGYSIAWNAFIVDYEIGGFES